MGGFMSLAIARAMKTISSIDFRSLVSLGVRVENSSETFPYQNRMLVDIWHGCPKFIQPLFHVRYTGCMECKMVGPDKQLSPLMAVVEHILPFRHNIPDI